MTTEVHEIGALPQVPAVYVMYGGPPRWPAYVGVGGNLRERIGQHLVRRDSSIVTGTAAVGLNPDHVREIEWWEDETFDQRERLEAAELIAFTVFDPALRSRGHTRSAASENADQPEFVEAMTSRFRGPAERTSRAAFGDQYGLPGRCDRTPFIGPPRVRVRG